MPVCSWLHVQICIELEAQLGECLCVRGRAFESVAGNLVCCGYLLGKYNKLTMEEVKFTALLSVFTKPMQFMCYQVQRFRD